MRCQLPDVVEVQVERRLAVLDRRDLSRDFGKGDVAQEKTGECIAARTGRGVLRRCGGKGETATAELVAVLVVLIAPDFGTETEGVFPANDRGIVQELERAVLIDERTVRAVADSRVIRNSNARDAPRY